MESSTPERTDDGRYIIVKGRRWRAADPAIPQPLKDELVRELMSARRAIKAGDESARARVHAAKTALGERGEPWWEQTDEGRQSRAGAAARTLLQGRRGVPVYVKEVALIVGGEQWERLIDAIEDTLRARQERGGWRLHGSGAEAHVVPQAENAQESHRS